MLLTCMFRNSLHAMQPVTVCMLLKQSDINALVHWHTLLPAVMELVAQLQPKNGIGPPCPPAPFYNSCLNATFSKVPMALFLIITPAEEMLPLPYQTLTGHVPCRQQNHFGQLESCTTAVITDRLRRSTASQPVSTPVYHDAKVSIMQHT